MQFKATLITVAATTFKSSCIALNLWTVPIVSVCCIYGSGTDSHYICLEFRFDLSIFQLGVLC